MKSKLLSAVCVAVFCIILCLGLFPFHAPLNQVTWLTKSNGILFGNFGTVQASGEWPAATSTANPGLSIELWVQPARWKQSATLISLYRPQKQILVILRQSRADLEIYEEIGLDSNRVMKSHFYVDAVFDSSLRRGKSVFITLASGKNGSRVYTNGGLSKYAPGFRIPWDAFGGYLILGDAPRQPDNFRGQVRGLAVYGAELSGSQTLHHLKTWSFIGKPEIGNDENNAALYLFNEKSGPVIHNLTGKGPDLHIPQEYMVVDKEALEPFWKEFDFSRGYWSGNLKNVVGFMPVGFCFYAFFTVAYPLKRALLITVLFGTVVSLIIEIVQIFLPTRDSGTTDLMTNTFGTYLGILCYTNLYPAVLKRFPMLGWLAPDPTAPSPEASSTSPTRY